MEWIELSTPVKAGEADKTVSILNRFGQGGAIVEEREPEADGKKSFTVKIYIPHSRDYKAVISEIKDSIAELHLVLTERRLKPEDWLESLKRGFGVLEIGDRLIIKPSWIDLPKSPATRTVIEIDPGAAFGTGLHPTTRLCLIQLEKYLKPGMTVLDLGTGTGILAIAAVKMGAGEVTAADIDPVAVRVARRNAEINGVKELIKVKRGTLSLNAQRTYQQRFDILVSNITAQAISDLAEGLIKVIKPGGKLIVSGIHSEGLDRVLISLALAGFNLTSAEQEDQWYVVIAEKNQG